MNLPPDLSRRDLRDVVDLIPDGSMRTSLNLALQNQRDPSAWAVWPWLSHAQQNAIIVACRRNQK